MIPGPWELMIVLGIVVVIFGAGRLPTMGRDIGKMIRNFSDSMKGKDAIDVTPKETDSIGEKTSNKLEEDKPKDKQD